MGKNLNESPIISKRVMTEIAPELVILEVTQRCNMNCAMCYNANAVERKEKTSTTELKNLICQIKELGCKMLSLTGGEPFLREDLLELISYTQKKGIECVVYTNGILLEKYAEMIIKSGLSKLFISLDSHNKENYEKIRGISGTFELVLGGIRKIAKLKKQLNAPIEIRTAAVIMQSNIDELVDLVDFSRKLGVDGITFKPVTVSTVKFSTSPDSMFESNLEEKKMLWPTKDQISKLDGILDKLSEEHDKDNFVWDTRDYFQTLKRYFRNPSNKFIDIRCKKGYNYLVVDKDGYILPCWGMRPKNGWNIKRKSVEGVWNSEEYEMIRKKMETCNHPCGDMLESRTHMR
jgi:MoaA/NifB/PqqE/SkfB family radical SAM enzyme